MYNGIGLSTVRGSGTNGYVTRNLSHVRPSKDKVNYKTEDDIKKSEAALSRGPNQGILDHERKRKLEVKCLELEDVLKVCTKVLFIFRCSKNWQKKSVHHHLLTNDGAHFFFANFYCSER